MSRSLGLIPPFNKMLEEEGREIEKTYRVTPRCLCMIDRIPRRWMSDRAMPSNRCNSTNRQSNYNQSHIQFRCSLRTAHSLVGLSFRPDEQGDSTKVNSPLPKRLSSIEDVHADLGKHNNSMRSPMQHVPHYQYSRMSCSPFFWLLFLLVF